MNPPIIYTPKFVATPNKVFEELQGLQWEHRDDAPRMEYYVNDFDVPYTYGRGRGVREYRPRPTTSAISYLRNELERSTGFTFEACFLNRYMDQRDHLGWHSDDSPEMDDARPIGIISLGVEREIWFTPKIERSPIFNQPIIISDKSTTKLKLGHGSLCLMAAGMQDTWEHKIPKASFQCGERISLTFRGYVKP